MSSEQELTHGEQRALLQEASLAASLAASGMGSLRRANFANQGDYYQAFFGISISLERMLKLIVSCETYLERGKFATDKELRKLSHKLVDGFARVRLYGYERDWPLGSSSTTEMLEVFSRFAVTDRYHNFDYLGKGEGEGPSASSGPVADWYSTVLSHLPVSKLELSRVQGMKWREVQHMEEKMPALSILGFTSETGDPLNTVAGQYVHEIISERVRIEGSVMTARLYRYLARAFQELDWKFHGEVKNAPNFTDFFYLWLNGDAFIRGRKTFVK